MPTATRSPLPLSDPPRSPCPGELDLMGDGATPPWGRRRDLLARAARRAARLRFRLLQARRYQTVDLARVAGLELLVLPEVFHPEFFFATALCLRFLRHHAGQAGRTALDMGTGSGAVAICLARAGARVTAVDIHPQAVCCARANVLLHGLEQQIEVLQGDLFGPLAGRHFDLILFNPPFYARPARGLADSAWAGGEGHHTLRRFLCDAPRFLRPGGELLIVGSTEASYTAMLGQLPGYHARVVAQRELIGERLGLFALRPVG